MTPDDIEASSTTEGLPVSPSLGPALRSAEIPTHAAPVNLRVLYICLLCVIVGLGAGYLAQVLIHTIWFITNLAFFGHFSLARITPPKTMAQNPIGPFIIAIPVIGAVIIGLMARYGSRQVAGHGIPEAMEQVLVNQSRIPPKMTFLKPLSAAISIGTGGPYGAEGPIIATGGALGSLLGQLLSTTAAERKVLLAAGASAGIAAAFGSPVAAVLLAIELLLFEFRPRSIIPVAMACAVATVVHVQFEGPGAFFPFTGGPVEPASQATLAAYTILGALIGVGAVILTQTVYTFETFFEHLPIHWMWHPAIGAIVVGLIGYWAPWTLGSGYFNIDYLLSGQVSTPGLMILGSVAGLLVFKYLSWTISLASGTSGGTLAPVFTIGGALAAVLAVLANRWIPDFHIDVRVAALVGMVAIFAGSARALMTCIVFAFETTHEPWAMLPAVCGCAAAYLVSSLLMRHSIMTEKIARQGVRVPDEYSADFLDQILVRDACSQAPVTLRSDQTLAEVRKWIGSGAQGTRHQGFPVVDNEQLLVGVVTRRDLLGGTQPESMRIGELITRPPVVVFDDCTLRDAADHMVNHDIGRLPVVSRTDASRVLAMVTRSDVLRAHRTRLASIHRAEQTIRLGRTGFVPQARVRESRRHAG